MGVGRQSIGAGRQSMGGRSSIGGRSSMGGRSSLGGSKSSRRSSIHANATGTSDPRPMSDKTYKAQCIRNLIEFLTQNGYNGTQLSPKILSAPSNKDFIRIFQFVYSFVDPNYNWGDSKPEDEIPQLFKMVGYPFTVNKSAIFSSGSPHNWPKLLGALTWLVELATVRNCLHVVPSARGSPVYTRRFSSALCADAKRSGLEPAAGFKAVTTCLTLSRPTVPGAVSAGGQH